MASADLNRRVGKLVGYPPLSELTDLQRREFHEALLEADTFEDLPGSVEMGALQIGWPRLGCAPCLLGTLFGRGARSSARQARNAGDCEVPAHLLVARTKAYTPVGRISTLIEYLHSRTWDDLAVRLVWARDQGYNAAIGPAGVDAAAKGSAFVAGQLETVSPLCPEPPHSDASERNSAQLSAA